MWLFTTYGFFSVVAYAVKRSNQKPDAGYTTVVDPTRVAIRARKLEHLKNLQRAFPELKGKILKTKQADYCCRLIVAKELWTGVAAKLAAGISYDNFKNECHEHAELDQNYVRALHDVWAIMYEHQRPRLRLTNR